MNRCSCPLPLPPATPRRRVLMLGAGAALVLSLGADRAMAQDGTVVQRPFPATALRGKIGFGVFPEITLNGQAARLSPGSRIRGQDNLLVTPASIVGQTWTVHYTTEINGMVQDVWILRSDELARKPWPTTASEAQAWSFDPGLQAWSKP